MSISSIDEEVVMLGAGSVSAGRAEAGGAYMEDDLIIPEGGGSGSRLLEMLKAETGSGSIESYLNHPMNFNSSKAVARMLRGLTGMFGSLNYAIIDIVIGGLDLMKNSRKAAGNDDVFGGSNIHS